MHRTHPELVGFPKTTDSTSTREEFAGVVSDGKDCRPTIGCETLSKTQDAPSEGFDPYFVSL